ncbi:MAG: penicillin acylase family protein, partial [Saprospiraceae bacterium]|nr:penicillin acylase family protein [Saprospiraceae bacterium]
LLTVGWCYFLDKPIQFKDQSIPALGKFFSPFSGFWQNGKEPIHNLQKIIRISGIEGSVIFDERAVPHIRTETLEDAYFIQGYLHAMHRLWQMDFSTRAAEGRISEIIGDKAIQFDKNKRRKGLAESARKSIEVWKKNKEIYSLIESYSNGVNFYIENLQYKDYPIEYKLMNFSPEKWSPYRSSLFHKAMSEILCGRDHDASMTNAKLFFGKDFTQLFPEIDSLTDPVVPNETKWNFTQAKADTIQNIQSTSFISIPIDTLPSGLGSNNWAIGSSKSVSGNPILCNDPHLSLTLPCIWYEQQITTADCNVYGVGFAGLPGVLIGFNHDIAWGITNAGWDVVDWYKIHWKNSINTVYRMDSLDEEVKYRIEEIKIKNKESVFDTIKITRWGPVVYEDSKNPNSGYAMHWIIQEDFNLSELSTFVELNKAKNYNEYRDAIKNFSYPAQNIAYADREGNIALTVQGAMPIKANQQGRFIQEGNISQNGWKGFIEMNNNPHYFNPKRAFISSANQRSTNLEYPNYYNNGDFRDYRGTLINRLLSRKDKWTVDELKQLQFNNYSLLAETSLPFMLSIVDTTVLDAEKNSIIKSLRSWNMNYDSNSIEAVYFEIWFQKFYNLTWDEITSDSLKKYVALPSEASTINLLKKNPTSTFFDLQGTSLKENASHIILQALDSVKFHMSNYKNWAKYKSATIEHLAKIPTFGIPYIATSGSKDIINASWKTWGPSWRMIVELTQQGPVAYGVYPGGQDGRPGNKHYMDMIDTWQKGQYYQLQFCTKDDDFKKIMKSTLQFTSK